MRQRPSRLAVFFTVDFEDVSSWFIKSIISTGKYTDARKILPEPSELLASSLLVSEVLLFPSAVFDAGIMLRRECRAVLF